MPNRIIKESAFTSDRIAQLSDFEFRLWVGLITQADDVGRGDARPAIIKGRVFALRERVTIKDIDAALHALAAAGCVSLYTVGGKPYYAFPSWAAHQRVRDVISKYPAPQESELDYSPQVAATRGNSPQSAALIQSESISESESNPKERTRVPRFTPPTVETVAAYCRERGNGVDAERFCSFYQSNGWKVGKNPMEDWKAAVRTWEKNGFEGKQAKPYKAPQSFAVDEFFEKAMKKSYGEEKHGLS